jgi:SOS response regulatory protein OraA/RecX
VRRKKAPRDDSGLSRSEVLTRERNYILWLLTGRDYSRKKLESKLRLRGLSPIEIQELLDNLEKQKLYQPTSFVRARTRSLARKGYSSDGISRKLREDGIRETATQVNDLLNDEGIASETALKLLLDKGARKATSDEIPPSLLRKCLTRGHRYSEIIKAWKNRLRTTED